MSRRGALLEFAVLGLLHEGPMHGYELRKRLNAALGAFRALSYGTLYPCLREPARQRLLIARKAHRRRRCSAAGKPASAPGSSTS